MKNSSKWCAKEPVINKNGYNLMLEAKNQSDKEDADEIIDEKNRKGLYNLLNVEIKTVFFQKLAFTKKESDSVQLDSALAKLTNQFLDDLIAKQKIIEEQIYQAPDTNKQNVCRFSTIYISDFKQIQSKAVNQLFAKIEATRKSFLQELIDLEIHKSRGEILEALKILNQLSKQLQDRPEEEREFFSIMIKIEENSITKKLQLEMLTPDEKELNRGEAPERFSVRLVYNDSAGKKGVSYFPFIIAYGDQSDRMATDQEGFLEFKLWGKIPNVDFFVFVKPDWSDKPNPLSSKVLHDLAKLKAVFLVKTRFSSLVRPPFHNQFDSFLKTHDQNQVKQKDTPFKLLFGCPDTLCHYILFGFEESSAVVVVDQGYDEGETKTNKTYLGKTIEVVEKEFGDYSYYFIASEKPFEIKFKRGDTLSQKLFLELQKDLRITPPRKSEKLLSIEVDN
ncbi:MAG: hypothetical protein OEY59_11345 [Deltaproteobacteria bacterium]|nr:hypothetical protein [Deltaproteobacteria bacterium]